MYKFHLADENVYFGIDNIMKFFFLIYWNLLMHYRNNNLKKVIVTCPSLNIENKLIYHIFKVNNSFSNQLSGKMLLYILVRGNIILSSITLPFLQFIKISK